MRKLVILLAPLLILALIFAAIGCGDDDDEEATATPTQTQVAGTPTPQAASPTPGYTGGEHTFKFAHIQPVGSITDKEAEYLDERLRFYTDGKVKLEIFPASSLYGSFQMWDAMATGALDMSFLFDYQLQMTGFVDYQILWLNFFWGETMEEAGEHNKRLWNHPEGGKKMFAQVEERGVKMLATMPNNNMQVLANDFNMQSIYDMKDKKIAGTPGVGGLFVDDAGGVVVIVDPTEFAIAYQQGLVDILPWGAEQIYSLKIYDLACCSLIIDVLNVNTFLSMSLDLWDNLEPELQDIIQNKVIPELIAFAEVELPLSVERSLQNLRDVGMELYYIAPEERIDSRNATWEIAKDIGILDQIDQDLLKLADHLRSEPYDTGYFFP